MNFIIEALQISLSILFLAARVVKEGSDMHLLLCVREVSVVFEENPGSVELPGVGRFESFAERRNWLIL